MAVNVIVKDTSRALIPFKMMSQVFLQQTLDQIQRNLDTQRVWPYEIYPNFHSINEIRKQNGQWYATGEGYQSLEGEVKQADVDAGLITFAFRFNDYMQYVDIGVGAGRKADDVDRAKNVTYKSRYTKWNASEGKSHRPAIMPELRHLATRLEDYVGDFYGKKFEFDMLETFEGLTITV